MSAWTPASLRARIADPDGRTRHAAGSPDPAEVAAYATAVAQAPSGTAVVLGMTPELRAMAVARFARVVCVDASPEAIVLYRDWVEPGPGRETIILGDWLRLPEHLDGPVDAILGDGVFPNLPDLAAQRQLLELAAAALGPDGVLVTRQVVLSAAHPDGADDAGALLERYRAGALDEAEFGFATRLLGHTTCCYDAASRRLDNRAIFAEEAERHARGELTDAEHAGILRYAFDGPNSLLTQEEWEATLRATGYGFERVPLAGRDWYRYYPVYACRPR